MDLAIITGVSKGLGESIAKLFLEANTDVIGISRTPNNALAKLATEKDTFFHHIPCDLGDQAELKSTISTIKDILLAKDPETVYVINNAATLEPIDHSQNIQLKDLSYHVHVNTIAPMALMNATAETCYNNNIFLVGVNITSGAAGRAVFGWSLYCSTKASIDSYTKTIALEQNRLQTGNKIIAFNPSIMDTEMQQTIRSTSEEAFIDVNAFKAYKTENMLKDSYVVAGVLYDIISDKSGIENGKIYDVSDYF
ncbi:SDR family NAD(P)-dependent oxidoreductase [Virgibacillus sp. W0181]|uniref:SDR family NAD(P)-dependent oxidoreductase n=1 Tax=Virgibacillus sp. W0181 TaxID=3391581 RepID=UPI003F483577